MVDRHSWVVGAARVKEVVSNDLKTVAVQFVGSRRGLIRNHALRQPVLGGEGTAQYVELVDHLERRVSDGLKALGFRLRHRDAVEDDRILKDYTTIYPLTTGVYYVATG